MNSGIINQALDYIADHMVEKKLLWTNANPSSSFSSQNVQINLSNYDAVEVEAYMYAGFNTVIRAYAEVGGAAAVVEGFLGRNVLDSGGRFDGQIYFAHRRFDATSSAVGFGNGAYALMDSPFAWSTDNTQVIPYKIYGIKFKP